MSGKLMHEWTMEMIGLLAKNKPYCVKPFEVWRKERDERVKKERADKEAAELKRNHEPVLTYVVHGFQYAAMPPVGMGYGLQMIPPQNDRVTLLYAGPDEDHAREIAVASSTRSTTVVFSCSKQYYKTRLTECKNGKPGRTQEY